MSDNTIVQVNYYKDSILVPTGTTLPRTRMFDRQDGTTGAANDLKQGILPDNRQGQLTGVLVKIHNARDAVTGARARTDCTDVMQLIDSLWLTLFVNNNEMSRGPISSFPHPPIWHSLSYTESSASDAGVQLTQNGGYMLFFQNIPVASRQRIRVELETRRTMVAITTATEVEVQLQFLDEKAA